MGPVGVPLVLLISGYVKVVGSNKSGIISSRLVYIYLAKVFSAGKMHNISICELLLLKNIIHSLKVFINKLIRGFSFSVWIKSAFK